MKDLGARSITAVFWGGRGAVLRIVLQLFTQIALARILGPAQYGLFAIGAIVISFSNFFSDIGIAYGLIQKTEVAEEDLRFVFTWQVLIGGTVTLAVAYFSLPIAIFLGDANAQGVVFYLAAVCLLNALAAPSNNMLKRSLNVKSMQLAQVWSYIGGYIVVGLPLALSGMQVWALVVAWIVQASIALVLLYGAARHPLRPLLWHADARAMTRYGGIVLITNITNWLIGNIDRVIIARFFSSKEVGLYATSYNLLQSPTSALLGVVQPVFFSASSRITDDKAKIVRAYYAVVSAIALFMVPAFASVAMVSETFVAAVYGPQWADAAAVFRPLALAMPLFLMWGMTTPLLWTGGSPLREFKAQVPVAMLWIAVAWVAAHHSMTMVGWAVCAMFAFRCMVVIHIAAQTLHLSWMRLWMVARGGLLMTAICAAASASMDWYLRDIGVTHAVARLAIEGGATAALYLVVLFRIPELMSVELGEIFNRVLSRSPVSWAQHLRRLTAGKNGHVKR